MDQINWKTLDEPAFKFSVQMPTTVVQSDFNIGEMLRGSKREPLFLKAVSSLAQLVVGKSVIWSASSEGISFDVIFIAINPLARGILANPELLDGMLSSYCSNASNPGEIRDCEISGFSAKELTFSLAREIFCLTRRGLYVFRAKCPPDALPSAARFFSSIVIEK